MVRKLTNKQFAKKVYELVGGEYTFLETYVNSKTKLPVVHNKCGHRYIVTPDKFLNSGRRCPSCSSGRWTNETFLTKVRDAVGDEYIFLESYAGNHGKIEVVHNTCGNRYEVTPNQFLNKGRRCPACNLRAKTWTNETFLVKVRDAVGDEYTFLESYVNSQTKIEVVHNTCGYKYEVAPKKFLYDGTRCPACNESRGERRIVDYLDKLGIIFEREKTFSDLKVINSLRYDFAVYHKGELLTLIEYDGEQHFIALDFFGGEDYLLKTQEHDRLKNEYAEQNNIPILRIPYNKYDSIDEILDIYISDHFRSRVNIDK